MTPTCDCTPPHDSAAQTWACDHATWRRVPFTVGGVTIRTWEATSRSPRPRPKAVE